MQIEVNNTATGERRVETFVKTRVTVGRGEDNDIVLPSRMVSSRNLVLTGADGTILIRDIGRNVCLLDGQDLAKEVDQQLLPGQEIALAEFSLRVLGAVAAKNEAPSWHDVATGAMKAVHEKLIERQQQARGAARWEEDDLRKELEILIDAELARWEREEPGLPVAVGADALYMRLVQRAAGSAEGEVPDPHSKRIPSMEAGIGVRLDRVLQSERAAGAHELGEQVGAEAAGLERGTVQYLTRVHLDEEIRAMIFGFGPLERLLHRTDVSEIMVVGKDRIFIERAGGLEESGLRFLSEEVLVEIIRRMVSPLGRRIDRSQPLVDGRLKQGYRINAVVPPVAIRGSCLTIRKFPERGMTMAGLVERNSLSELACQYLQAFVSGRKNIVVSGGTGSGKTTLLNALSGFIGSTERIVTVEDSAELRLQQPHVVTLETIPANQEGKGRISIRDLVINALRMRPDRIIVGECRGPEAVDMLQAMNTGHAGSMTSLHANSSADTVRRLESMVLGAQDMPLRAIREQIASAVDIIVSIGRVRGGGRRVLQVTEVVEVDVDTGEVVLADLFKMDGPPDSGELGATGRLPTFVEELIEAGHLRLETLLQ